MTERSPRTEQDESPSAGDQALLGALDGYLDALHAENIETRSQLMARHPELAGLMRCLDDLESLAPESTRRTPAPAEASPSEGPILFGRYELVEEIGRGGMGVVHRARQPELNRVVALKLILASSLASDEEIRRFLAESKAAGGLRHPNIVAIHEAGQFHGQHYFTMDLIDGPSLAQLLARGRLDADQSARLIAAVARAVDYLHQHHIVHRDLKPSNILIDEQGNPYVTDFGLAKVFDTDDGRTRTGTIIGTPSYMSPEQAAGRTSEVTSRSDVYSLGAILYELLTGRPPFKRENPLDTLVEVLEGEPTLPRRSNPDIPLDLERVCLKCLEKDPAKRYSSAAELADDLERFLRREPVLVRPADLLHGLRRWARRQPALACRLGGLFAAAAIVQAKYMYNGYDLQFHWKIMGLFGVWAVTAVIFQLLANREQKVGSARFGWAAVECAVYTTLIYLAPEPRGLLLIGYPLLIVASGLFFRVRLVWFTTIVSLLSYAVLVMVQPEFTIMPHYAFIFAASLGVLGVMVAYQVYRVRALSRYYEHRPLP